MDNTAAQRSDSTKFSEKKPFKKCGAIEPPFTVLIVGRCSGSIAPNFRKRHPSEALVHWNDPSLLSVLAMDNTAAQLFDSTNFHERKPFRKAGSIEPPCLLPVFAMDNTAP